MKSCPAGILYHGTIQPIRRGQRNPGGGPTGSIGANQARYPSKAESHNRSERSNAGDDAPCGSVSAIASRGNRPWNLPPGAGLRHTAIDRYGGGSCVVPRVD